MRKINVKKETGMNIYDPDTGKPIVNSTVGDAIKMVAILPSPNQQGLTGAEQRKRFRIIDQVDDAKRGIAEFEDHDWELLCQIVEAFEWQQTSRQAVKFEDMIKEMEEVKKKDK